MERIKFIVREVNKLLGTTYNLLSFDALGNIQLQQIVCDILRSVDAGSMIKPTQDASQTAINILCILQSIKYAPPEANFTEFCSGVTVGDTRYIYPILEWLLNNQTKIKKRAYLSRYVNKLLIPREAAEEPEVIAAYRNYERMIGEFWFTYKESMAAQKECAEATELQIDIKKMNQDIKNVTQRTLAQRDKLGNIQNKENLVFFGKTYRAACTEHKNLTQQMKENVELIKKLEFKVKNMEEKWQRRDRKTLANDNICEVIEEEARVNKIFLATRLPHELEEQKTLVMNMEETLDGSCQSRDTLQKSVAKAAEDVQKLMNEHLHLLAHTEDKLGPFRKQAGAILVKKVDLTREVNEMKTEISKTDESIREKQVTLFNVVGGEILHGDELKNFIAMLREKSNFYKQLRVQLQGLSTELGIENRTLDVLKSMDASIETAYFESNVTPKEEHQTELSTSVAEAKLLCKQFMQEVDALKTGISQVHQQLVTFKKDSETVNQSLELVKEGFDKATRAIVGEIQVLRDKLREIQNDIDLLEKTWKTSAQNLDKSEYIFNRLIDEMIGDSDDDDATASEPYLTMLKTKRDEIQKLCDETQVSVKMLEENKKREQETIEFLKHTEYIVLKKLDEDP